jgi:hypothetical protein
MHRWLGRWTVAVSLFHGALYFQFFTDNGGDAINRILDNSEYAYGAYAALCGVVILLTSLDYVRRNFYEFFYWLHFAFIGFCE